MKLRNAKRKNYRNRRTPRKVVAMKFIEVGEKLYPLNDRIIFRKEILPNGSHQISLNYTDGNGGEIKIGDVTNYKDLPFEKQIEKLLAGRIKELKF